MTIQTQRRSRILQVCAVDFTALHLLRPLLQASRDAGFDTAFACNDGPGAEVLRKEGFPFRPVAIARRGPIYANVFATASLASSLRREPVDIVHTHTPVGGVVGRSAAILANSGIIVHTFHGLPYASGSVSTTPERLLLQAERLLGHRTDHFFSQGAADADRAVRLGIARRDRIEVIGNGVDLSRFVPSLHARETVRAELGIPQDAVIAVTVSRLVREKGLLDLAQAAMALADVPNLFFLIVGDALPSDRDSVAVELSNHAVVATLGRRWQRLGYRADVDALLQAGDMFVLPSYREGLPRSIVEAMACGLPCVMTDIPAGRELVGEDTGLLMPPGDARALASAIRLLAIDPEGRRRMGERARKRAVEQHDEASILNHQLRVYARLLKRPESY